MRSRSRLAAALISTAMLASLTVSPTLAGGGPTTWWVDDDFTGAPGNCDAGGSLPLTIQEAIDTSSAGDTIIVCPGTYDGALHVTKNDLTIRSLKKWQAVLRPASDHIPDSDLVTVDSVSGVAVRLFRITIDTTGSCEYVASALKAFDAPDTIFRGNKIESTGGAGLDSCGFVTGIQVSGNSGGSQILHNVVTDFMAHGIYDYSSGTTLIWGNRVNYQHASYAPNSNSAIGIVTSPASGGTAKIHLNTVTSLSTAGTSTPKLQTAISSTGAVMDIKRNTGRNVATFIYALGGTSGKIKKNRGWDNVQNGLLFNQSSGVEVYENQVTAAEKGINVDSSSSGNNIHDNDWGSTAAANDCNDASSGGGTANTANTWTNNVGSTSSPPGICTAAP